MEIQDLERELAYFGFSRKEALVYVVILQNPDITGYQVSKILNLTKSTAYTALNSLFERGAIYLVPGDSHRYHAKDPTLYFESLKAEQTKRADRVAQELAKLTVAVPNLQSQFVSGYENTMRKIRETMSATQEEMYISCHLDLHVLQEDLKRAAQRGVRIIVFTYEDIDFSDIPVEVYRSTRMNPHHSDDQSIIVVSDLRAAIIAYGGPGRKFSGTYSEDFFFVSSFAGYINLDVVLQSYEQNYGPISHLDELTPDTLYTRRWFPKDETEA